MKFGLVRAANGGLKAVLADGDTVFDLSALDVAPQDICSSVLTSTKLASATVLGERVSITDRSIASPIARPDKIYGVGMNYHGFVAAARGAGIPVPAERLWFQRPMGGLVGAKDDIWLPQDARLFDFEGELAIIIGQHCRRVSRDEAAHVIAGYSVANDMTVRELVPVSITLAKAFDTHMPLGPWIATPAIIPDPQALRLRTWVNGTLRQDGSTGDMIASCFELIAELSQHTTLHPGDIILTGTPEGCGILEKPPVALKEGDIVRVEIERIGAIENRIVAEPPPPTIQR